MAWHERVGVQSYLTESQMKDNATEICNYFRGQGMTLEAICGLLGNIQAESGLNPGNKETASSSNGWGLIQWTPATVLLNWCNKYNYTWYSGSVQCYRILCEGLRINDASGYWIPTSAYPYSWQQFSQLTNVEEATKAYLYERERAGVEAVAKRVTYANNWFAYFSGQPIPPTPPEPEPPEPEQEKRKMPLYMMIKRRNV